MILTFFIIIPILAGVAIYVLPKVSFGLFLCFFEIPLLLLAIFTFVNVTIYGEMHNILGAESSVLGIELIADRYSSFLVILSITLFFLSTFYTLRDSFLDKKFIMLFLILQGLLCGIFLTDDLFNIYVLLEVATVIVAILIMFKKDSYSIYDGMIYLFSQIVCMIFYLFGVGYLYKIFGVLSISEIEKVIHLVDPSELVLPFSFIMTGICLKSAFFPLFSWLPSAHGTPSAPSAVSAILSGLYVKNGIYLFFVFTSLFGNSIDLSWFFLIVGGLTAVLGFIFAIGQSDIKLILAFHTISQIGLIAVGLSFESEISNIGALYHIVNHAIFKSLLFLGAGAIIKEYGTRNIKQIRGVLKRIPYAGFTTLIGILAITGAPLLNGSISKYFIQYGVKGTTYEHLVTLINIGTAISFVKYSQILWGDAKRTENTRIYKRITLVALAVLCVLGGIFGNQLVNLVFDVDLTINIVSYLEKTLIYAVTMFGAYLFYKFYLSKSRLVYKLSDFSMNFLQIVLCMVLFYITITLSTSLSI